MQSYYAARAREYDRVYDKPERQADIRALREWLPSVFRGKRVLEVACGTGYWTQDIAPVAAHVVAIDSAPETMEIAAARVPPGQVDFVVGDAYQLPLDRGPFDAAFAGFWFSHVPKARQAEFLRGLSAAVEPDATIVLVDNRYVGGSNHPLTRTDADGNTYQARRLDDGSVHEVLKIFPSEAELRALIEGVGHSFEYRRLDHYWAVTYRSRR